MSTRIVRFTARNFMGLTAVDITPSPDSHKVVLAGRNRQGKSSAFEAIRAVLFGKKAFAKSPIRNGASQAEASVELDNGLKIELVIGQGSHKVKVTKDGKKPEGTPAAILKSLVSDISADPMQMASMDEPALLEVIRKLTGLDTTDLDLQAKQSYDTRTEVNRDVKSLKARLDALAPEHPDAPAEELVIAQLLLECNAARDVNEANDKQRKEADQTDELAAISEDLNTTIDHIADLEEQLAYARNELDGHRKSLQETTENEARLKAACAELVYIDIDEIETRISTSQQTNAKVRHNKARAELAKELAQKEQDSSALTQLIEETEQQRTDRIAAVKMPVEGLAVEGSSLLLNGVPLAQASHSQTMELCVAIAALVNPELSVLLVEQAYCCDADTLQSLYDIARNHNPPLDIWLETLAPTPGAFVIEAGKVAEIIADEED